MDDVVTSELNKQAIEWFSRMRAHDVSAAERRRHAEWLAQDKAHQEAYRALDNEWRELDELASWADEELGRLQTKFSSEADVKTGKRNWWAIFGLSGLASSAVAALVIFLVIPLVTQVDRYETLQGEQRKVVLQDGSSLHLNSSSSLEVQFTDEAREIVLLKGEALFDVAHESNRPFIVRARDSKFVAVGTSFSVYYKNGDIDVTVVEGLVAILPAKAPPKSLIKQEQQSGKDEPNRKALEKLVETGILLNADHQATVNAQGEVEALKEVDATKLTAWNRGLLVLDGMPLRQVAEEISRYIPGEVRVATGVPDYPVTGVIKIRDRDTMLDLLSQVVPVTAVKQSVQVALLYSSENNVENHVQ